MCRGRYSSVCGAKASAAAGNCSTHNHTRLWPNTSHWDGWRGYCTPLVPADYERALRAHWTPDVVHTLPAPPPPRRRRHSDEEHEQQQQQEEEEDEDALGVRVGKEYPLSDQASFQGSAPAAWLAADGDYNVLCPALTIARSLSLSSHSSPHRQRLAARGRHADADAAGGGQSPPPAPGAAEGGEDDDVNDDEAVLAGQSVPSVYVYYFSHGPVCSPQVIGNCSTNVTHGWALHTSDVAFVTGQFGSAYHNASRVRGVPETRRQSCTVHAHCVLTPAQLALVTRMQSFWGSFIRSGRPVDETDDHAGAREGRLEEDWEWPAYNHSGTGGAVMQLDLVGLGGVRRGWKREACAFWDRVAPFGPH
jgi:hypothetical protein